MKDQDRTLVAMQIVFLLTSVMFLLVIHFEDKKNKETYLKQPTEGCDIETAGFDGEDHFPTNNGRQGRLLILNCPEGTWK